MNKFRANIHFGFTIFLAVAAGLALYFFVSPRIASLQALPEGFTDSQNDRKNPFETPELAAFRESVGGKIKPLLVELHDEPVSVRNSKRQFQGPDTFAQLTDYALELVSKQDNLIRDASEKYGVRMLMRRMPSVQIDGSVRIVEYRFTYLLNGFVAYVATDDIEKLRSLPEVFAVSEFEDTRFWLDNAIDYSLGTQTSISDRRFAVYGATQEFSPRTDIPGHPEAPYLSAIDGFEGQGINIAIIDSGVDWRHPMFGGIGNNTPLPRVSGQPARSTDNRKVIYYYALSSPGDPTDDFGHGTLVASCAAGFRVGPDTPRIPGFYTGVNNPDGTPGTGIGPTPGGIFFGTAPQARIMGYKVCGPAPQCPGDIPLSMEDAASPYTLVASGNPGPTPVAKPVADVINLSLGDTAGSATAPSARAANNAALNGTIVVASAGNSGPGAGTVGSPSAATLAISVAASLDPGSIAGGGLLVGDQIPNEACDGNPARAPYCDSGTLPLAGPPAEYGTASNANNQSTPPFNFRLFPVAGGGPIFQGSVSAHYVHVNLTTTPPSVPDSVTNRIALVTFTGAFAAAANQVATKNPAAILLITTVESATAVQVVNGIPTYTINPAQANVLLDLLIDGMQNGSPIPPNGSVSLLPIRASESTSLSAFTPSMAGFSSRGPNDHPTANYRQIKPDVTAPGVGVAGAATPEGIPDDTVGLASTTGYTQANGTSFSGPITAGAMAVIRHRVRTELGLDTANLNDANYRNKRFDAVTVSRALLQNSATNLRTGLGVPENDPASLTSINDLGAGHINIAGALALKAIMVSPTLLLADADPSTSGNQPEFNVPLRNPPALDPQGNLEVLLPTASFGNQAVAGRTTQKVDTRKVIIRDITRGGGRGTYNISFANNRNVDGVNFGVSFTSDAAGNNPINQVTVPSGGTATFYVRTAVNGATIIAGTEFQWYVYATHSVTGQTLRMPFYYRAVSAGSSSFNAPNQTIPNAQPGTVVNNCHVDLDGSYQLNWIAPAGTPPSGYRIEEASSVNEIYFDNADTPLVGGANSRWSGSAQWISQINPNTTSLAYFIPNAVQQNESLTMTAPGITLPAGQGATLSFLTNQSTEQDFDFMNVEISNNGGVTYNTLGSFSGVFAGTREFDISPYAGSTVRVRFRMVSDLLVTDVGTYIENIRVTTSNFTTLADVGPSPLNFPVSGRTSGTRFYRIAGLFSSSGGTVVGPYSNSRCVTVP
jgi:hypothetical protein